MFETEDRTIYKVIINKEEQYSIYLAERENPLGWTDVGKTGTKDECEAYIKEVWTDMRPLSLRKKMEEAARERAAIDYVPGPGAPVRRTTEEVELEAALMAGREAQRRLKGK